MKLLCLLSRWIELLLLLLLQGQSYFPTIYNLPPISKDRVTVSKLIVPRRERERKFSVGAFPRVSDGGGGGDRKVGQLIGAFTDKTGRIEDQGGRRGRGRSVTQKVGPGAKGGRAARGGGPLLVSRQGIRPFTPDPTPANREMKILSAHRAGGRRNLPILLNNEPRWMRNSGRLQVHGKMKGSPRINFRSSFPLSFRPSLQ